jgi:(1->4)-alpha-D-glucan 1-alpha-D-glucosylmutase
MTTDEKTPNWIDCPPKRVPVATYRLQMGASFGFQRLKEWVPYLHSLGVTDAYLSPILKPGPGSTHGYDICDHSELNPELGTNEDFQAAAHVLRESSMGILLDIVPNHMGIHPVRNHWWRDVLENGQSSRYAAFFDIDWDPLKPELNRKILLPVLGDQYGLVLERGELKLDFEDGALVLKYFEKTFPVNPRQAVRFYRHRLEELEKALPAEHAGLREFMSILTGLQNLPPYTETDPEKKEERRREKEVAHGRMLKLTAGAPEILEHIRSNLAVFNGKPGDKRSFDLLHELLEAQVYRLAYWKTACHEINYRRFFDINDLAGLRMEDPKVFEETHRFVLKLAGDGLVTGLRIDHIDGLYDPAADMEKLQEALAEATGGPTAKGGGSRPFYVVVEKILSGGEPLPARWLCHGSTGYKFLNDLNGLFLDPRAGKELNRVYRRFTGDEALFEDLAYQCKKTILDTTMAGELNVLAQILNRFSEKDRASRDFTLESLREALREVLACFPVYRSYAGPGGTTGQDRFVVKQAVECAQRRNPASEPTIFHFILSSLTPPPISEGATREELERIHFTMKFQQFTGPVQAKGIEDTAFYRYGLLMSLNEVGGDPRRFGCSPEEFHELNRRRLATQPYGMNATATHDTKRGEDARMRLNVLSLLPVEWRREVSKWSQATATLKTRLDTGPAPDKLDEYLFYQALLSVWPVGPGASDLAALAERLKQYMLKTVREAKRHTSWLHSNPAYEKAVGDFAAAAVNGPRAARFLALFQPFAQRVARFGAVQSLSQLVLKAASPGIPDFYQGTELWDFHLVDPDNRNPVDYALRQNTLKEMESLLGEPSPEVRCRELSRLLESWEDGKVKLFLTAASLRFRREWAEVFLKGSYEGFPAKGAKAEHVVALSRRLEGREAVAVVPRWTVRLAGPGYPFPVSEGVWEDTSIVLPKVLAGRTLENLYTRVRIAVPPGDAPELLLADLLRTIPVGLFRTVED